MARVWLMRHAPTAANAGGGLMGRRDPPPLAAGLAAAAAYGATLEASSFDLVTASPLRRAIQTARAAFPDHAVAADARLAERGFGTWEGRSKTALRAEAPTAFAPSGVVHLTFDPPGGEPLEQLLERVASVLADWRALGPDATVFAVTHNGVLRAARHLLGEDLATASARSEPFLAPFAVELP